MTISGVNVHEQFSMGFTMRSHNATYLIVPHINETEWVECTMAIFEQIRREDTYKVGGLNLG